MHYLPLTISQLAAKRRTRFFKVSFFAFSCLCAVTLFAAGCGKDAALENTKQDSVNISAKEDFSGNEPLSVQISDPLAALMETGRSAAQKNILNDTWSRHAFLLEDHTIFSVRLPERFWCGWEFGATIWCPRTSEVKQEGGYHSSGAGRHYFLTAHALSTSEDSTAAPSNSASDFIFADGSAGKLSVSRQNERNVTFERIFSPSGKQFFDASLVNGIYKMDYQEYAERMRASMMFHENQISVPSTADTTSEKVFFHSWFPVNVDMELPAGSSVSVLLANDLPDKLTIYLTEDKNSRLTMYLGIRSFMDEEWGEFRFGTLVDKSYREKAAWISTERNGQLGYLFVYGHGRLCVDVRVPSGDEKRLQEALDVVRSIHFLAELPKDEW